MLGCCSGCGPLITKAALPLCIGSCPALAASYRCRLQKIDFATKPKVASVWICRRCELARACGYFTCPLLCHKRHWQEAQHLPNAIAPPFCLSLSIAKQRHSIMPLRHRGSVATREPEAEDRSEDDSQHPETLSLSELLDSFGSELWVSEDPSRHGIDQSHVPSLVDLALRDPSECDPDRAGRNAEWPLVHALHLLSRLEV